MADGGATYTVNIELATRQFSQDLRNLKTKIQNELGKAIKVETGGTGATSKERALAIRKEQNDKREQRRIKYNADQTRAQLIEKQRLIERINKLQSFGYKDSEVKKLRAWAGEIDNLARGNPQAAQQKIKDLRGALDLEDKILQTIINQGLEKEKQAKQQVEQARKIENRARKGPYGQRMYGPIDKYGTQVYTGYKNPRTPPVPKSGASLPIDLGRKGTGTFATKQTELLRRRQTLETLLETFKGVNTDEVRKFKTGIQTLITEYSKVSDLQTKMRPTGMGGKVMGGWGAWKDDKLITKDKIGVAGTLSRQLEQLDNLTKREEFRGKQIRLTIRAEEEFLNKKHRIEKLLATFDKKGVATDAKRLKLEKAITVQDKQQLDTLLRELEIENIGLRGVSGTGGRRGGRGSTFVGGPSSPLNVERGWVKPGPKPTGKWGRMGQSAMISGGFPLLFGQNPAVAAVGAAGGAIGEAITPGGGFAGGIAATALTTAISQAVASVGELGKALNKSTFDVARLSKALGASGTATEKYLTLLKENEGKQAAYEEGLRRMNRVVGIEGVAALQEFSANMEEGSRGLSRLGTQISAWFANLWINRLRDKGLLGMGGVSKITKPFDRASLRSQAYANEDPLMKTLIEKRDATKLGTDARFDYDNRIIELQKFFNLMDKSRDKALEISEYEKKATRSITDKNLLLQETLQYGTEEANIRAQIRQLERMYLADGKELTKEKKTQIALDLEQQANLQRSIALYRDIGSTIKSGLVEGINAAIDGTKSLGEIAGNVFRKISNALLDYGVSALLANSGLPGAKKFFGFADGGRPPKGRASIVGERGPELFVPDSAGTIIPNHEMGGANVVVNVDASGSSVEGDAGAAQELGDMLAAAIQAELVKEKRPGGLLA